jgi:hypothetical protein
LVGAAILPSGEFFLDGSPGQSVAITARTATQAKHGAGVLMFAAGVLAVPAGLLVTLVGALQNSCIGGCPAQGAGPENTRVEVVGGLVALAGIACAVGGLALALSNERSQQTQQILLPESPRRPEAWLRAPMWRDSVRDAPARANVPVFSRSF